MPNHILEGGEMEYSGIPDHCWSITESITPWFCKSCSAVAAALHALWVLNGHDLGKGKMQNLPSSVYGQ